MRLFRLVLIVFISITISPLFAGEGMWLPLLLKAMNEEEMQKMGMKMTAEDIYSVNKGSLKDAIVHFGGFCTSSVISDQGLLLTNHHCGYGQIQSHSSVENNYLKNGFWAQSKDQELSNPGLFAKFIVSIEDVTEVLQKGMKKKMGAKERQSIIDKNKEAYLAALSLKKYEDAEIKPFFNGNQYFLFITKTYNDVRLVGAPPESIGKFGADTDNWVWPRHTGDFALFRIYADENNEPAEYSPTNKPYTPKHFLPVSTDGVEEGDFTLIFGFPGRTSEYLPSDAIEQIVNTLNPAKIEIRDQALKIMDKYMRSDESIRIQYASKFASIANYWKKWIGESQGLKKTGAVAKKKKLEAEFMERVNKTRKVNEKYPSLLASFSEKYAAIEKYALARDYYSEVFGRNIELFRNVITVNGLLDRYQNSGEDAYKSMAPRYAAFLERNYSNYNADIDMEVAQKIIATYVQKVPREFVAAELINRNLSGKISNLYSNTLFADKDKVLSLFEGDAASFQKKLSSDPAYAFAMAIKKHYDENVAAPYNAINEEISELQKCYMTALLELFPEKRFYPDANSTMRVTYGNVEGYEPRDGMCYKPSSTLDGVIEKYVPGDYEFDVDENLRGLHENKDYGSYADENGKMPVCFIGSNHTTGGNSGSPVIDAHGNLIGLNFDRVWEGTMSDYNYDRSICRNIMVDARYILFIIDKYARTKSLINELSIVSPKSKN